MNQFEEHFFEKYVPEGQEIQEIIHGHWIGVVSTLFFWGCVGVILPSFFYLSSERIQDLIPLMYLQGFLLVMYVKIIYEIFNWYNDVWILTDTGIVDLDWAFFKKNTQTIDYENIEGVEIDQNSIWDSLLRKGDIIVHKIGDDDFVLEDVARPYVVIDIIEELRNESEQSSDQSKLDLILENLGGIMEDFLERKGLRDSKNRIKKPAKNIKVDKNSIDLR